MTACPNCGRDLTARECAAPEHRAARGFTLETETKPFHRWCPKCETWKPTEKFWGHGTNSHKGHLYRKCGTCRFQAKVRRNLSKRGERRAEQAATDAFWDMQRRRPEPSTPERR